MLASQWVQGILAAGGSERVAISPSQATIAEVQSATAPGSIDGEIGALARAEAQLRELAANPDYYVDEEHLFRQLNAAHTSVLELERAPPTDARGLTEIQRLCQAALHLAASWLRLAAAGGTEEGASKLRGAIASELACSIVVSTVASESGLGPAMLMAFTDLGGVRLFGAAVSHLDESVLVGSLRKLRIVASRCTAQARREGAEAVRSLVEQIESFRRQLFVRLQELAARPKRRLRVPHFKEMVAELGSILSGVYNSTPVFEMGCLLSLHLTVQLSAYCRGVAESDALEAIEWMASVMRNLLDQTTSGGALSSPFAIREWVDDNCLWKALLWRAGGKTQLHSHHVITVLLTKSVLPPVDFVGALAMAGALSPSPVPTSSRLALQGALVAAVPSLASEVVVELFNELCSTLGFEHISQEGIDLLVRMTHRALSAGHDPVGSGVQFIMPRELSPVQEASGGLGRSLAMSYLLRYLYWGYRKSDPPEQLLETVRRALMHSLLPNPSLTPLLPALAAEALSLAATPAGAASRAGVSRCAQALSVLAVDAASASAAAASRSADAIPQTTAGAVARICAALPPVGIEAPFGVVDAKAWVAAFIDTLACFLRLPGAQIATPQVGSLWSRLIVRPLFNLPVTDGAMQYFRLAVLAHPAARSAMVAPLLAAPNPPPEVSLAHLSIFCPASFEDNPPPLSADFFFPEVPVGRVQARGDRGLESPPKLPGPTHRSVSSPLEVPDETGAGRVQGGSHLVRGTSPVAPTAAAVDLHLERPRGLAAYTDVQKVAPGHVFMARHNSTAVALKVYDSSKEPACQRELQALKALRHVGVAQLQGLFTHGSFTYLELAWCDGGTLLAWCQENSGVVSAEDTEAFVICLGIHRQLWQALSYVHWCGAAHGDVSLENVLLTADQRPVLADFTRCNLEAADAERGGRAFSHGPGDWRGVRGPSPDYVAPEVLEAHKSQDWAAPTQAADVYAVGVVMAKAFLGLHLQVSACPYMQTTGQRRLPDDGIDVDLADLLQSLLALDPEARPTAQGASAHRALDPTQFLRRRGKLGQRAGGRGRGFAETLLSAAEQLREDYRGHRVDEPLMFEREAVFDAIANSMVGEWTEEALLGEWRVMLTDESGVDGGGLRREVMSLFFEQLEQSSLVIRSSGESSGVPPTLFIADRQQAARSPQQWRQMWTAVGAMILRAIVHFGNAPLSFSSAVFDCVFGRIGRLPPDTHDSASEEAGAIEGLMQLRRARGDEWARSEMLDLLRRIRKADVHKEAGYRWMLAQRMPASAGEQATGSSARASPASAEHRLSSDALETMGAMLEQWSYRFLVQSSSINVDGAAIHSGAVLEWSLLWDIYLKYLGGGDRWLAYEALHDGLTARGHRQHLWSPLTGEQIVEVLEGAPLTPEALVPNLEFKPNYGYDLQIQAFRGVIQGFSADELSMFLRFATGIGKLPASRRFPTGQKLSIRFMPDQLDRLPSAHTCFWVVDLPPYTDQAEMAAKLRQAIAAPQPFALS